MSDNFTGRWLVSEYVYNSDGSFVGIVQQKRYLETYDDGRIRVIQDCEPLPELDNHPMADFRGQWEFDLIREGRLRHYHGPDVIGTGYPWGDKAMTGEGIWSQFGHNFTSFAFVPTAERQLTGGTFYNSGEMIAKIIGIAHPETNDNIDIFPTLADENNTPQISKKWRGTVSRYDLSGNLISENTLKRSYTKQGLIEQYDTGESLTLTGFTGKNMNVIQGEFSANKQMAIYGKSKTYGCYTEDVLYTSTGLVIRNQIILDNQYRQLIMLRRWYQNLVPTMIEISWLSPT